MTPTNNGVDPVLIDIMECNIRLFLSGQRRLERNPNWFTVEQIADELDMRSQLIPFYLALKKLSANPNIDPLNGGIRWSA